MKRPKAKPVLYAVECREYTSMDTASGWIVDWVPNQNIPLEVLREAVRMFGPDYRLAEYVRVESTGRRVSKYVREGR